MSPGGRGGDQSKCSLLLFGQALSASAPRAPAPHSAEAAPGTLAGGTVPQACLLAPGTLPEKAAGWSPAEFPVVMAQWLRPSSMGIQGTLSSTFLNQFLGFFKTLCCLYYSLKSLKIKFLSQPLVSSSICELPFLCPDLPPWYDPTCLPRVSSTPMSPLQQGVMNVFISALKVQMGQGRCVCPCCEALGLLASSRLPFTPSVHFTEAERTTGGGRKC